MSTVLRGDPVFLEPAHLGSDLAAAEHPAVPSLPVTEQIFTRGFSLSGELKNCKIRIIRFALDKNRGNWAAAARDLGMHRSNLHNLAKRLGLKGNR